MVIVIGGTGFIGIYTVEKLLEQGYKVLVTGRNNEVLNYYRQKNIDCIKFDMTDTEAYKKLPSCNVEAVILLAGLLPANTHIDINKQENTSEYIKVNTLGTINVLEYCRKNNIKKVISTTSYADVANKWSEHFKITEKEPRNFKYCGDHAAYVISKNAATDMMIYYNEQHKMQCSIFRLPPVYGVGPHSEIYVDGHYYKTGIQTFIERAQRGENIEIWGNPMTGRDIIYVKDVAQAFVKALQSDKAKGLYNITSGVMITLEEQVKIIRQVFSQNRKSQIIYRPDKKNNTPSFLFDNSKAISDFGFNPQYIDYKKMMEDYKAELKSGRLNFLIQSRKKIKER